MHSRAFAGTSPKRTHRTRLLGSLVLGAMLSAGAYGPFHSAASSVRAASGTTTCAGSDAAPKGTTLTLAYSANQEFNADAYAVKWFAELKKAFEAAHPGVTVNLEPIRASQSDYFAKTSLMLRSASTTPDVIHEWTQRTNDQVAANQLAPLDDCVASWSDWKYFPQVIRASGAAGPHVWQLNSGVNNFGLYYDINYFAKAGLPTTWAPKNWNDVLKAARAIKAKVPNVVPLWLYAGNQLPDQTTRSNFLDLLAGTHSPLTVGGKWVVKSQGLLDTFNFYHTVFSEGLGPTQSMLASPVADSNLTNVYMPKQQVAIALVGSWAGSDWIPASQGGPAPWPGAIKAYRAVALPTQFGQGLGYVTMLSGSNFVLTAASPHKKLAFELMAMAENHHFNLEHTIYCGEVPPRTDVGADPAWLNSVPYYNQQAVNWLKYGTFFQSGGYTTLAAAVAQSTGEIEASGASAQQALDDFTRRMTQILGASNVTTTQ